MAQLQGKLEAAEACVVSQTELVRRMEAQAALKRPTNFDMASESKDTQLRALERAETKNALAVDAQGFQMSNYNERVRVHRRESCVKFSFLSFQLKLKLFTLFSFVFLAGV